MKKTFITTLIAISALTSTVAFAAPFDWVSSYRNSTDDDNTFYSFGRASSTRPAVIGTTDANVQQVYYYLGNGLRVDGTSGSLGVGNFQISVDLGGWNPLDVGNLGDLLDAKSNVSTVTALSTNLGAATSSMASVVTSLTGINLVMAEISANLYGTSTSMRANAASTTAGLISKADKAKLDALSTSTASQVQSDWTQTNSASSSFILHKPVLGAVATTSSYTDLVNKPTLGVSYEGTTQRTNSFPIFKSATVSSGTAAFNLTNDGLSTGTTLCTNGVIQDSVNAFVSDATASYQMSYAFSNSNKTVTVTTNKLSTANILTGVLGQAAGNGSAVKLSVWCY